jgi:hypothetical protein
MALPESKTFERFLQDERFRRQVMDAFRAAGPYIEKFALGNGLHLSKWYHDLPTWLIEWQEPGASLTRAIHIGVAQNDAVQLGVAVDAYQDDPEQNTRHALPRALPVGQVSVEEIAGRPWAIDDLLQKAYHKGLQISPDSLTTTSHATRPPTGS